MKKNVSNIIMALFLTSAAAAATIGVHLHNTSNVKESTFQHIQFNTTVKNQPIKDEPVVVSPVDAIPPLANLLDHLDVPNAIWKLVIHQLKNNKQLKGKLKGFLVQAIESLALIVASFIIHDKTKLDYLKKLMETFHPMARILDMKVDFFKYVADALDYLHIEHSDLSNTKDLGHDMFGAFLIFLKKVINVIFNTLKKNSKNIFEDLLPAEYVGIAKLLEKHLFKN